MEGALATIKPDFLAMRLDDRLSPSLAVTPLQRWNPFEFPP
jgi:hypothetical protein